METRIALASCAVIACALCGRALADSARRRAQTLKVLSEGLRVLHIHMTGMCEPVRNALEHTGNPLFALVAGSMEAGRSAGEAWRAVKPRALRRGGPADALLEKDILPLDRLFEHLGQSGREEQEALLNDVQQIIAGQCEIARSKAGEADRLYVSLGLLLGLMLALILI